MIKVKMTPNALTMSGHASYDVKGQDIICASASMLMYTLAQIVENHADWLESHKVDSKSGKAIIRFRTKPEFERVFAAYIDVISTGFMVLSANFPENVKFTVSVG